MISRRTRHMKDAKFKVSIAIVLIVCSSLALFIPLGNASAIKKDRDIIHVPARTIPIGRTIYGLSTPTKQYFKFVVREEKTIAVQMWPTIDADYDLYLKWTPNVIPQAISAGDPVDNCDMCDGNPEGEPEMDSRTNLSPGTYYIMVHNYSGSGTYDLSVFGSPKKPPNYPQPDPLRKWFNDTRRGTALYLPGSWAFRFVTPDRTFWVEPPLPLGSHQPIALMRNNKVAYYYENSELKIYVKFIGTRRGTLCIAHLNDKSTGNNYLLVAFRKN